MGIIASNAKTSSKITYTVIKERKEKGFSCVNGDKVVDMCSGSSDSNISGDTQSITSSVSVDISYIGWGKWYSLKELEIATNGFSVENVIGQGGYGIVYRGILPDNSVVAVKNLLNKKGQAEKEFKVEVEAIGKVRHKNLVSLLGYCAEGVQRMLVYEYVDNGNLEQWLGGDLGYISPLSWDIRMKIAIGTAKGCVLNLILCFIPMVYLVHNETRNMKSQLWMCLIS
ncbi:hypothetical protein IFM89_033336 [Coptis chinensis]|uniref:Protein kinase domain-containing protein n=1 Tax=Coptis chinensis TaxID=261450 RepID=A0A835LTJ5_9MAGN|nr:hypothetical protein IFM89_033336 [Coptis chinensis]